MFLKGVLTFTDRSSGFTAKKFHPSLWLCIIFYQTSTMKFFITIMACTSITHGLEIDILFQLIIFTLLHSCILPVFTSKLMISVLPHYFRLPNHNRKSNFCKLNKSIIKINIQYFIVKSTMQFWSMLPGRSCMWLIRSGKFRFQAMLLSNTTSW